MWEYLLLSVIVFPAECSPPAHERFIQGVIKLHNSAYDEAAEHFRAAQGLDADCVMAYWGEAMTFNHTFWGEQDIAGGRKALAKLAPTRAARLAKAPNSRERGYLSAIEVLYGEGDRDHRDFSYGDAMQKLAFDNPTDFEASAFYAAAILGAVRVGDPDLSKQTAAGNILKVILEKYPDHPGALHYLIHAYDHPTLAAQALDAARHYETVADGNFHALHMPSHIYVQLGMWTDVVRSNETAFQVSARRDYHSLDWLQYAEMQLGMYQKARTRADTVVKAAQETRAPLLSVLAAEMAARLAVESQQWDALAGFPQTSRIPKLLFAQGLFAVAKGDQATAQSKVQNLDALIREYRPQGQNVRATQTDVLKRQLSAAIAVNQGQFDLAERLASEALDLEAGLRIPSVLEQGGVIKPAAEFLGELLLQIGKPEQAAAQFEASLKAAPKRALSLLGLARSRIALAETAAAEQAYRELAEIWANADPSIPALREVRK